MTWPLARTTGVARRTMGQSFAMASQSALVREARPPAPVLTPLLEMAPGRIFSVSAPMEAMVFLIWSVDPWPISTMAITAAMPMMMPRMVRAARMGLRTRALMQVLRRGRNFIRRPC